MTDVVDQSCKLTRKGKSFGLVSKLKAGIHARLKSQVPSPWSAASGGLKKDHIKQQEAKEFTQTGCSFVVEI